ncbi:hypothetical protein K503DRAFT_769316 [Rhizopogon vinicolor AM-OR11-026]|uniref:Uncharacterized protein n=1 Tax=Rhizopogon vinicolor AM-OR11-026 TaxID=1314800 RepID=A0A1B7N491_9AGAM|nr:hypothetical protein K503DRAFT_769316 [Rhizopogon vinicolor AM-OR11-026]
MQHLTYKSKSVALKALPSSSRLLFVSWHVLTSMCYTYWRFLLTLSTLIDILL